MSNVVPLMNVVSTHIKHRKLGQDGIKLLLKRVLCKLDLSHVKIPYPTDFEVFVNDLGIRSLNTSKAKKWFLRHTVGVFRCVLERTMSRKSAAVGTGAIALRPLVDMVGNLS